MTAEPRNETEHGGREGSAEYQTQKSRLETSGDRKEFYRATTGTPSMQQRVSYHRRFDSQPPFNLDEMRRMRWNKPLAACEGQYLKVKERPVVVLSFIKTTSPPWKIATTSKAMRISRK